MTPDDAEIARILRSTRVIAVAGLSPKPERPSYGVAAYLQRAGYRIIPVNPGHAGQTILGETVYGDLASIPDPERVEMVNIFRRSEDVPPVVEAALAALPGLRTVWMQLGIANAQAAARAESAGKAVVEDRCIKIEHARLIR